jgi:hypothetical protein
MAFQRLMTMQLVFPLELVLVSLQRLMVMKPELLLGQMTTLLRPMTTLLLVLLLQPVASVQLLLSAPLRPVLLKFAGHWVL